AGKPSLTIDEVTLLPPIPEPRRIICVGQNYAAHRDEMGGTTTTNPLIFTRYPSSLVGHNEVLIKPPESEQFDFEGELAVIIGKRGRRISPENALSHIAGYSCFMDGSIRDYQNHTTQYIPGKNFDQSGSFGPWMVSADEIPDPNAGLSLKTRLNDQVVQETTTDLMMFNIPTVIAYLSTFTTLDAGDVIASGTPGGVGYKRKPQLFMKPGDKIEVEIESVATLTNSIVGE
ncbi:MAG: 2-keto-4-pentenoate hydratase/2-oxohepta-3-ene-1,7-dioic acid hydratase in catechol pathway, partial [Gammaproteobacteria bacterium]